jgi:membrane-associated phospholipid phosphatase
LRRLGTRPAASLFRSCVRAPDGPNWAARGRRYSAVFRPVTFVHLPLEASFLPLPAWSLLTRLGESQILLPAFAATMAWLRWRLDASRVVLVWAGAVLAATGLTTLSKVAFLGWGLGYAPWDFTGISGHAMFALALWPLLAGAVWADAAPMQRRTALAAAYALALVIALSRVVVGAHSSSEVLAGALLGLAASGLALRQATPPRSHAPALLVAGLVLWLAATPLGAPASPTHGWVVRLSLVLSGHATPYTREQMHADYARSRATR